GLGASVGERVVHFADGGTERDREPGLLAQFALRRLGEELAGVYLALGQRDILVLRAVHEQDLDLLADHSPADNPGSQDRCGHRSEAERWRAEMRVMRTFCMS